MISYSEVNVFNASEQQVHKRAIRLVACLDEKLVSIHRSEPRVIRCHELARAVGSILDLPHEDGKYGIIDHSWLLLTTKHSLSSEIMKASILDVYAIGRLPQVQLLTGEPRVPDWKSYKPLGDRDDIDEDFVIELRRWMEKYEYEETRPRPECHCDLLTSGMVHDDDCEYWKAFTQW